MNMIMMGRPELLNFFFVIQVHFDGWNSCYDYWIDADSPDIHPVGWCSKTGHPLQPPLSKKPKDNKNRFHFLV